MRRGRRARDAGAVSAASASAAQRLGHTAVYLDLREQHAAFSSELAALEVCASREKQSRTANEG